MKIIPSAVFAIFTPAVKSPPASVAALSQSRQRAASTGAALTISNFETSKNKPFLLVGDCW